MELSTIFMPIGIAIFGIALVAMIIIYNRILHKKKEYVAGKKYEDEYGIEYERLMGTIPQYGVLLLIGLVMIIFSMVMSSSY